MQVTALTVNGTIYKLTREALILSARDNAMAGNRSTSLPQFESVQALVDYFDTHDMGEHLDQMAEVSFDVDIQRRQYLVAIDAELMKKLAEIANAQQVSPEVLINTWLRELALRVA